MVKAIKGHNLHKKFKSWRKGKSANAKKGTLKAQLRGQQRLLPKARDDDHRQQIEAKIQELEALIEAKRKVDRERENAKKSHGARFLERQKLTRMEKHAKSNEDRLKVALDLAYVAHFPLERRYVPLFRNGERIQVAGRNLAKRATARGRVLEKLGETERVKWMSDDLYEMLPSKWSLDDEIRVFGKGEKKAKEEIADHRFASAHSAILEAADEVDAQLDEEFAEAEKKAEHDSDSSSNGVDSDSDESEADAASTKQASNPKPIEAIVSEEPKEEDSGSSSSSSDDSSSDDSGSSDEDDSSSHEGDDKPTSPRPAEAPPSDDEDDDFLVAADEAVEDPFSKANRKIEVLHDARGDKSQGWATQRQRPGQFKKRRTRR